MKEEEEEEETLQKYVMKERKERKEAGSQKRIFQDGALPRTSRKCHESNDKADRDAIYRRVSSVGR